MAFKVKDLMISVLPGQGHGAGGPHPACKLPVSLPCFGAGGGTIICDDVSCGGCSLVTCGGCSVLPHHLTNGCHPCSHCTACSACSVCTVCTVQTCVCSVCSHPSFCGPCSFAGCTINHSVCQICSHAGCSHISCLGCSVVISHCGACSFVAISVCGPISPCGGSIPGPCGGSVDPGPIEHVENLAALKAQLQQALANVEAQEKAAEESMQPKTVEEVDDLTKKLTEALAELKGRKEAILKENSAKKPPEKSS